jgi:hypothetical protein
MTLRSESIHQTVRIDPGIRGSFRTVWIPVLMEFDSSPAEVSGRPQNARHRNSKLYFGALLRRRCCKDMAE